MYFWKNFSKFLAESDEGKKGEEYYFGKEEKHFI